MNYPKELTIKTKLDKKGNVLLQNRICKLVEVHKHFAVYENNYGYKECFDEYFLSTIRRENYV